MININMPDMILNKFRNIIMEEENLILYHGTSENPDKIKKRKV